MTGKAEIPMGTLGIKTTQYKYMDNTAPNLLISAEGVWGSFYP